MQIHTETVTVGIDPEVFVTKGTEVVSAIGLIGGSKEEPRPVKGGALQEDNVLAEFNIEPCHTEAEFIQRIDTVMSELKLALGGDYGIIAKPSHEFTEEVLLADPCAMRFGCDPDMNCWTRTENPSPDAVGQLLRTAGGHVHIGYENPNPLLSFKLAQSCDVCMGIPSVIIDQDVQRRTLYGKAGACRLKPYGVEYRTLSNFWLADVNLQRWIFNAALDACFLDQSQEIIDEVGSDEIQRIINESDVDAAYEFVHKFGIGVPAHG